MIIIRIKRDFEMQRIEHYIKGERRKKKWKRNGVGGEHFRGNGCGSYTEYGIGGGMQMSTK